ncbi:MAG: hypothetical protein HY674_22030 [Chloroflexi bacterium]|nr:hypothetical protein [Chloroflexota bacterium]
MKLSCSHAAHGFQPLLENLPKAKRVTVLTYSLDEDPKSPLFESLRRLPETSRLIVVTNIPGRWPSYSKEQLVKMRERFNTYLDNLVPDNFACASEVCFSFENHAKALIVDDMAYVGSANFTKASANNYEAGVIVTEKGEIQQLRAFIEKIRTSSVPLLKAGRSKEARPLLNLLLWGAEIVRSVREDNGFTLSDDYKWIDDDDRNPRSCVNISERLSEFLHECQSAAEQLMKRCGGAQEVLNADVLSGVIEFVRYFEGQDYNDSLPKAFDEQRMSERLVEELLNKYSNEGNPDDVIKSSEFQERLEEEREDSEQELDTAVAEAVDDLVEHIELTISKLRSSFGPEDVSPQIDNTQT